jgi:hypothetical protein
VKVNGEAPEVLGLRRVSWRAEIRGNPVRPVREEGWRRRPGVITGRLSVVHTRRHLTFTDTRRHLRWTEINEPDNSGCAA